MHPSRFGGDLADVWWLTVAPAQDFSTSTYRVEQLLFVVLIAAALATVTVRVSRARGSRRVVLAPVAVAGALLAVTVVLPIAEAFDVAVPFSVEVIQNLALLAVPAVVLIAALRRPTAIERDAMPGRRRVEDEGVASRQRAERVQE